MKPPNLHQRINLAELKAQIVKKLGSEGSKQYFYYLSRFLSLEISKVEFNKLCIRIVGRENIPLHNQFVHSILKNACSAKVPLLPPDKEVVKSVSVRTVGNKEASSDGHNQSVPVLSSLSNGDILALSPRKARTGTRDRKVLDRRPNGKTHIISHQSSTKQYNSSNGFLENGDLTVHDIQRPLQHHQGLTDQGNNEGHLSSLKNELPDGSLSVYSNNLIEAVTSENWKEGSSRSVLCAPLGVPSYPVSIGGVRKTIPLAFNSTCANSFDGGNLLDTATLRERMKQIAATQGLEGVPMECANLVNNGLDGYLKGLIMSCIELVGARSGQEPTKSNAQKHWAHLKLVNGFRPNPHIFDSTTRQMEGMQDGKPHCTVSLLDFRVAMELNPQQLGEDWPLLLEKICTRSCEE
ncbi:hypothetical protein Vadar_015889 [Vaccinium darrowii]|uniref:Uncharacterized protein n=1 Tax=Vaccinium darrowii TaxID=229202 RepID=A0ACB7ZKU3_9ERIC|nr:hypothetical protein Vadar_015889 [Vaccinium darrowii]